ncbi:MAG TPA: DUF5063 domain-containing protein [Verrucomicrobiae bacterium]
MGDDMQVTGNSMKRTFKDVAHEFCRWAESAEPKADLERWLVITLSELIHLVVKINDDGKDDAGTHEFRKRDYKEVRGSFPHLPFHWYFESADCFELEKNEVLPGELLDDLIDIYQDLSHGLYIHEHTAPSEAERFWRQAYRIHWGEHATSALRALYYYERDSVYRER